MNHVIRGLDGINTEIFGLPLNLPFPKVST